LKKPGGRKKQVQARGKTPRPYFLLRSRFWRSLLSFSTAPLFAFFQEMARGMRCG
jgi:hypothetical protein